MHLLSVTNIAFLSTLSMKKVVNTVLLVLLWLDIGLATVFMFCLDLFVCFILKTATAIESSGVISVVKVVEKLVLSFQ